MKIVKILKKSLGMENGRLDEIKTSFSFSNGQSTILQNV